MNYVYCISRFLILLCLLIVHYEEEVSWYALFAMTVLAMELLGSHDQKHSPRIKCMVLWVVAG